MTDDRSIIPAGDPSRDESQGRLQPVPPPPDSPFLRAEYAEYPEEEEAGGLDPKRMIAAVLRHKWVILLLVLAGSGAGYIVSQNLPSEYEAQATIWIETGGGGRGTVDAGPIRSSQLLQTTAWVDLLRSFTVLDPVVIEEKLYLHPARGEDELLLAGFSLEPQFYLGEFRLRVNPADRSYVLETQEGTQVERGGFGDSVGTELGWSWKPDLASFPTERPVAFRLTSPRDESVKLRNALRTSVDRTGNFLRMELLDEDPEQAAAVLNALAERHVEVAADLKRMKVDTLVAILRDQLMVAEENLRQAEMSLEDFKINTVTLPTERSTPVAPGIQMTHDPVFSNYFDKKVELEQIRSDRDALQRALSDSDGVRVEALSTVGAIQGSPGLQASLAALTEQQAERDALLTRYTRDHRAVQQVEEELARLQGEAIPGQVNTLLRELGQREQVLETSISSASSELREIPPRAIEEARLERQVAIADQLYTTLEARYQEARLASASSVPDIRILDRATVPRQPTEDRKGMVMLLAVMGSLGLGIAGAVLRDHFDPRIRYPDDVKHQMGLTILGAVPQLPKRQRREHMSEAQEAFRSIRLNVANAFGAAGPVTLAISSPGPGDGKSMVASNLALAFAQLGSRVVLVDGDIRRGTLHHLMELDRKPGLTEFLQGKLSRDALIQPTRYKGLHVVTSGTRLKEGPELLSSPEMREFLLGLRREYDVVIVDSPPLGAGVDPFALATMTGHLLLVIRSGETHRELAINKLELLERLPTRVLGAIMNGVPRGREYGYGYYSYAYVPGYEAVDEVEMIEAK